MTVVAIEVSEEVLERLGWAEMPISKRIVKAYRMALKMRLIPEPEAESSDITIVTKVALSGSDEVKLRSIAVDKRAKPSLESILSGLVRAAARMRICTVPQTSGEAWIDKPRREQRTMCRLMADSDRADEILFLEASTGVGKGRALVAHAVHLVMTERSKRVVIAAPTIAVLGQLFKEYKTLREGTPEVATLIGMGEFVSEVSLRQALEAEGGEQLPDAKAADRWLKSGAKEPWGELQKRWLMASLEDAAPDFPLVEARLSQYQRAILSEDEDGGLRAYEKAGREAGNASIVFCTHARLALDIVHRLRNSKGDGIDYSKKTEYDSAEDWWQADLQARADANPTGLMPEYDCVLIDEAHLLDQQFDQATSDQISIFSLKQLIEKHGSPAMKTVVKSAFRTLTEIGKRQQSVEVGSGRAGSYSNDKATDCLRSLVRSMKRNEKSVKNKAARLAIQHFRRRLYFLESQAAAERHFSTRMFFTPSRRYPLIERSKNDVNRELGFLWKLVRSGVLTSATMYMPTNRGYLMHDMAKQLRVPLERAGAMVPIVPAWVTEPVTAHIPPSRVEDDERDVLLVPPKHNADTSEWDTYYERIVEFFERTFAERQSGGTLVLMTSYDGISEVTKQLACGVLQDRVMASVRGDSFRKRCDSYIQSVKNNEAPIWFTTGRAWTGLDLSIGKTAKADNAINYLVVPKLPVLINCSSIHRERLLGGNGEGRFGYREVWNCARYLRQGIGRLVRRRGVPEKELFVLDGRLCHSAGGAFAGLRSVFERYEKLRYLELD